ncbi:MAG: hypothetical protein ABI353_07775 [Isosphaeraceae bacterium]
MRHLITPLALSVALFAQSARAEHAKINLDVSSPDGKETAFVDQTPPETGKNPRPVLKAKVGDKIKVQWFLTNTYPHKTLINVVVHFYIAREQKIGSKNLPDLDDENGLIVETAFDMDFKPGARAGARTSITIDTPGVYLVRVESRQTGSDHEHFSAIDLVIEDKAP